MVILKFASSPGTRRDREPGRAGDRHVVERLAGVGAMRREDRRRSGSPAASAPARARRAATGRGRGAVRAAPERVDHRQGGKGGRRLGRARRARRRDQRGRHEGPGGVVDQHAVGRDRAASASRPARTEAARRGAPGDRRQQPRVGEAGDGRRRRARRSSGWITTWTASTPDARGARRRRGASTGPPPSGEVLLGRRLAEPLARARPPRSSPPSAFRSFPTVSRRPVI